MTASLNPYISQFAEEFDAEKSSQYRMAIQFSLGGLSFAILDVTTETLVALECYQSELLADSNDLFRTLERAMENKGLNNKELLSVTCLIDNRYCALIPEPVFSETDQTKYLDFAFQIPANYSIESERLENAQCFNVYALLTAIKEKVLIKWPNARITHSNCLFINSMMQDAENDGVFVNVRNRDFDLLIKRNGKLQFFNNFKFNTKDDFIYFLMFALQQQQLSGQEVPVYFAGLISGNSEIIKLCERYIKRIHFINPNGSVEVDMSLSSTPFQYYYIPYKSLS